jgi:hypothetical protein
MWAKRLATVVVAVGLIVGALVIRRNVIEGGDDGDGDGGDPQDPAEELVCLTELAEVCTSLGESHPDLTITVEDAGETLARIVEGEPVGLWLTFEPFPTMASLSPGSVLAASELAVATPPELTPVLNARCTGQALWRCIGDSAGEEWGDVPGRVQPSVGDAGDTALGLASFASAVGGYYGTAQPNSTEWSNDAEFLGWVRGLVREVPVEDLTAGTPVATMVTRPSAVNVAATSVAEIAGLGARAPEAEPSYPEPSMWLQAVLAAPAGADVPDALAQDAAAALRAAGWGGPDEAAQVLPSATTMVALRQLWEDVR